MIKYIPSFKKGTASDLDEAIEIIDNNHLLQKYIQGVDKRGNDVINNGTECGVWPSMVTMDVTKDFVATTTEEFEILCIDGIKASPEGLICIFEVEESTGVPNDKAEARIKSMSASLIKSKKVKTDKNGRIIEVI